MRLFFICALFCHTCFSQVTDSLLYQLRQIPNDTERVNQIYQAGFGVRNSDPDMAYQYALACNAEALTAKSAVHLAKSYNLLGILHYKKGDYKNALQFQEQALELNRSANNDYGIAINQTNLGNIYSDLNRHALAESSYLSALQAYNNLNNTLHITKTLMNIGVLKYEQKQFDAAISQFKEALVYVEEVKDHDLKASCYNNLGIIYLKKGEPDTAELYLEDAINLYSLTDAKMELADAYNNMALVYVKTESYDGALDYLKTAEAICKEYDFTETLIELYDTHSLVYEAQKNYEQAFFWIKKHDHLKDSMLDVEKENASADALIEPEQQPHLLNNKEPDPVNSIPFLIIMAILLIGIPLFLIRYKR